MGHTWTRERIYQAGTPAEVIGGCEEELRGRGWVPLTREGRRDGSLRVIYERLYDESEDEHAGRHSVLVMRPIRPDILMALAAVVMVCAIIVAAWSGLVPLATP